MSKESKLMKNTAIIAIGNICTKCISFFMLPLYTSILSTEEYGTVDLISTYVSLIAAVLTLQFEQGVFRYLIESRQDAEKQKEYITITIFTVIISSVAFGVILTPILLALHYQYTYYLVIWVIAASINAIVLQLPRGLGNNTIYAFGSFLNGALHVLLNVLFIAVLRRGVNGMLFASIISLVVSITYVFLRLKLWNYIKIKKISKSSFKQLASYSLPLVPSNLCWWVVNASDRIIINKLLNTGYNGIYAAACKFPTVFNMVTNIFQLAWTESAAENINDTDRTHYYQSTLDKAIRFYSSSNLIIIAFISLAFPFLIKNDFDAAYFQIPILMTGALFHAVASLYGSIYFAFKETKKVSVTTFWAAVINIVINLVFVKVIGLYAASISTLLAYLTITVIRQFDIQKITKITISKKYLLQECLAYIIVFGCYYTRNIFFQVIAVVLLIPYSIYQNKSTLSKLSGKLLSKIGKSK